MSVAYLRRRVVEWFRGHGRDFPWRKERNPFRVLVAEVLLQKTDAARVVPAYMALLRLYPTARRLAAAPASSVRRVVAPIGLVKRASHLRRIARTLVTVYGGRVPAKRSDLRALPGVGDYTADAVLCTCFGIRAPMLDGSTARLLRRLLGVESDVPAWADRELRQTLADITPPRTAREFGLGLLDLAAAFCRPQEPACPQCPLAGICSYGKKNLV